MVWEPAANCVDEPESGLPSTINRVCGTFEAISMATRVVPPLLPCDCSVFLEWRPNHAARITTTAPAAIHQIGFRERGAAGTRGAEERGVAGGPAIGGGGAGIS